MINPEVIKKIKSAKTVAVLTGLESLQKVEFQPFVVQVVTGEISKQKN